MKRLRPLPAEELESHSRRMKATTVRTSASRSKIAVQRASPVIPASGGFKEGDYPKGQQELHQDQERARLADVVEEHRGKAGRERERPDGQHRAAPAHAQGGQPVGEVVG